MPEQEVLTSPEKEDLSLEQIETLSKYVHMEGIKSSLNDELSKTVEAKNELLGSLTGLDNEKDFLSEKLANFKSTQELSLYLKNDKNLEEFFVNPETGETLELSIDIEDKQREKDFKRELLIYLKTTDDAYAAIDKEFEEMEKATDEINADLKEVCTQLSDNVLNYVGYLEDKAKEMEDKEAAAKLLKATKYIKSGYTLEVFNESLDKYPSVARHTVEELINKKGIDTVGQRYLKKLRANEIKVSLIPLISNPENNVLSIEKSVMIKDDEYIMEDLFIYSIIRYFSMANWDDANIKRAHASIALVMKRLISGELDADVKNDVLTAMTKYLKRFNEYIPMEVTSE